MTSGTGEPQESTVDAHPNWIAERAKCNMARLWPEVQYIVSTDVRRANEAEQTVQSDVSHYMDPLEQGPKKVHIQSGNGAGDVLGTCEFVYNDTKGAIAVRIGPPALAQKPPTLGALRTRWDTEALQCRIVVTMTSEDEPVEFPHDQLWKAVQVILEPFFFPAE